MRSHDIHLPGLSFHSSAFGLHLDCPRRCWSVTSLYIAKPEMKNAIHFPICLVGSLDSKDVSWILIRTQAAFVWICPSKGFVLASKKSLTEGSRIVVSACKLRQWPVCWTKCQDSWGGRQAKLFCWQIHVETLCCWGRTHLPLRWSSLLRRHQLRKLVNQQICGPTFFQEVYTSTLNPKDKWSTTHHRNRDKMHFCPCFDYIEGPRTFVSLFVRRWPLWGYLWTTRATQRPSGIREA